jgi:hypothetical protein
LRKHSGCAQYRYSQSGKCGDYAALRLIGIDDDRVDEFGALASDQITDLIYKLAAHRIAAYK